MIKSKNGNVDIEGPFAEVAADLSVICSALLLDPCANNEKIDPKDIRKEYMKIIREGFDNAEKFLKDIKDGKDPVTLKVKEILDKEDGAEILVAVLKKLVECDADD